MKKKYIQATILTDNQVALFYLGQEGFLFKYKQTHILIDPYLSDYVDRNCCTDNVKWVRNYPAPIEAKELDFIDYVLCTHTHYDHTDPATLKILADVNPNATFIVPNFAVDLVASYGISHSNIIGAINDVPINCNDCSVIPIPSAHLNRHKGNSLHRDKERFRHK